MKHITSVYWALLLAFVNWNCNSSEASAVAEDQYQCMPCGSDCDKAIYKAGGECPQCHMKLVKKATVKFNSVAAADICEYIKNHPDAILIDVRSKAEFEGKTIPKYGTLKNAINIPVTDLKDKLSSIEQYKNKEVLVFCSHSRRSPRAGYFLMQNGFTNVTNMDGGLSVVGEVECVQ